MSDNLKHKIVSGIFWQALERVSVLGLQFVIGVILARLLSPEDFGVLAIMMVAITLCQVFVDSGFSTALIQKKDIDNVDCNSVFYINIITALGIYAVLFMTAPLIAGFYNAPAISPYLRVLALVLVIRALALVQNAILNKKMLFNLNCRISWIALLLSGCTGIIMAYRGFGVWSLITQQLLYAFIVAVLQWLWVKWRPQLLFNWQRVINLFRFGWKLFCSASLNTIYNELNSIVIGKLFSLKTLSFYQQGRFIPMQAMSVVNLTINNVMLPAFSTLQDNREEMKLLARRTLKIIAFLLFPLIGILFITASPLVTIIFTEKWLPCVIFLQLSSLMVLFWPFHGLNLQIITACGRSDVYLVLEIIKKVQAVIVILATFRYGVLPMVCGLTFLAPLSFIENSFYNGKLINYPWWKQFKDLLPFIIAGSISGAAGWWCMKFVGNNWLKIFSGAGVLLIVYMGTSLLFKLVPQELNETIKKYLTAWRSSDVK